MIAASAAFVRQFAPSVKFSAIATGSPAPVAGATRARSANAKVFDGM
jgi:hypothetical protein